MEKILKIAIFGNFAKAALKEKYYEKIADFKFCIVKDTQV